MTLACIYGIYSKIKGNKFLIIDDYQVVIPAVGIQKKAIFAFKNVSNVNETKVNGNAILTIYSKNKKKSIVNSLFTKNEKYIEVKNFILEKINEQA